MITRDPVSAWRHIVGEEDPILVEKLKKNNRTRVFRLRRANGRGTVIAKRCRRRVALLERLLYGQILVFRDLRAPRLLGFGTEAERENDELFHWVFLEDLGPRRHDPENAAERTRLADWLGTLGASTATLESSIGEQLPLRTLPHFRTFLVQAKKGLPRVERNRRLPAEVRATLSDATRTLELVDRGWPVLEALTRNVPQVLVHGDCLPKNVHVVDEPGNPVVPIDWGAAGLGFPGTDLGLSAVRFEDSAQIVPDVEAYASSIRPAWPAVETGHLEDLMSMGRLLWTVKLLALSLSIFENHRTEKVATYLDLYRSELNRSAARIDGLINEPQGR